MLPEHEKPQKAVFKVAEFGGQVGAEQDTSVEGTNWPEWILRSPDKNWRTIGGICLEEARNETKLEMEIRDLPAGEGRGGSNASQSANRCCCYSAIVEDFIAMGAAQAMLQFAIFQGELNRAHGGQHQPAQRCQYTNERRHQPR